jgi:hypothetical protein
VLSTTRLDARLHWRCCAPGNQHGGPAYHHITAIHECPNTHSNNHDATCQGSVPDFTFSRFNDLTLSGMARVGSYGNDWHTRNLCIYCNLRVSIFASVYVICWSRTADLYTRSKDHQASNILRDFVLVLLMWRSYIRRLWGEEASMTSHNERE